MTGLAQPNGRRSKHSSSNSSCSETMTTSIGIIFEWSEYEWVKCGMRFDSSERLDCIFLVFYHPTKRRKRNKCCNIQYRILVAIIDVYCAYSGQHSLACFLSHHKCHNTSAEKIFSLLVLSRVSPKEGGMEPCRVESSRVELNVPSPEKFDSMERQTS